MTHPRDPGTLLPALERLARSVGVEVRRERLDIGDARAPGGLCRLEGRTLCILSDALGREEECEVLGRALRTFDLEGVFVPPALREYLESLE